jgi:hypothetical protein
MRDGVRRLATLGVPDAPEMLANFHQLCNITDLISTSALI